MHQAFFEDVCAWGLVKEHIGFKYTYIPFRFIQFTVLSSPIILSLITPSHTHGSPLAVSKFTSYPHTECKNPMHQTLSSILPRDIVQSRTWLLELFTFHSPSPQITDKSKLPQIENELLKRGVCLCVCWRTCTNVLSLYHEEEWYRWRARKSEE